MCVCRCSRRPYEYIHVCVCVVDTKKKNYGWWWTGRLPHFSLQSDFERQSQKIFQRSAFSSKNTLHTSVSLPHQRPLLAQNNCLVNNCPWVSIHFDYDQESGEKYFHSGTAQFETCFYCLFVSWSMCGRMCASDLWPER